MVAMRCGAWHRQAMGQQTTGFATFRSIRIRSIRTLIAGYATLLADHHRPFVGGIMTARLEISSGYLLFSSLFTTEASSVESVLMAISELSRFLLHFVAV